MKQQKKIEYQAPKNRAKFDFDQFKKQFDQECSMHLTFLAENKHNLVSF
jgi:hypothetical protein